MVLSTLLEWTKEFGVIEKATKAELVQFMKNKNTISWRSFRVKAVYVQENL